MTDSGQTQPPGSDDATRPMEPVDPNVPPASPSQPGGTDGPSGPSEPGGGSGGPGGPEDAPNNNARWWWIAGGLVALALILFFIFGGDEETPSSTTVEAGSTTSSVGGTTTTAGATTTSAGEEDTTTSAPTAEGILACQVTDTGGIDDRSFNQTAFAGIEQAIEAGLATEDSDYLESQADTDYVPNIQTFIDQGCDLIITVGFLLGDATQQMAAANPDQLFQIIDFAYDPPIDNVQGAVFGTTDAAFLAGYLAAATSESGVVATYGGIQIPCGVTCFMDGFVYGVRYYNAENGDDVEVLGWNPESKTGVFTGDFENQENGRTTAQSFADEGADVILPVAGPVGLGSAAFAQEQGGIWIIGVDADWFQTAPEYTDVILTSVLKGLDVAVFTAISDVANGTFTGGTRLYAIAEDGVGLGQIAQNETIDAELLAEIDAITAGLKDGSIVACDQATGPSDSCAG